MLRALRDEYEYDAVETCAADGSCLLACPVGIDTGKLIKQFRSRQHSERAERNALRAARHWSMVERTVRGGLRAGAVVGDRPMRALTRAARTALGDEFVPEWGEAMPPPASPRLPSTGRDGAAAVYFPACINRIFGPPGLAEAMVARLRASRPAGVDPRRRRRTLLCDAMDVEGVSAGCRVRGDQDGRRSCGGGADRASCRS